MKESGTERFIKVACPRCGKALPIRILHFEGTLKYSIQCKNCKEKSEVEISNTESDKDL